MSFWYHLPFGDLAAMPMAAMQAYMQRLPARMAELKLALSQVIVLPWMKAEDRAERLQGWLEETGWQEEAEPATLEDIVSMGIGVRHD